MNALVSHTSVRTSYETHDFLVGLAIISQQNHQNSLPLMRIFDRSECLLKILFLIWIQELRNWHCFLDSKRVYLHYPILCTLDEDQLTLVEQLP